MTFSVLNKKLGVPLYSLTESTDRECDNTGKGFVFGSGDSKGLLSRLFFLVFRRFAINRQVQKLNAKGINVSSILSVYPNIESPLIVFNQLSHAEQYCINNILPKIDWSIKGCIKRILFLFGQVHPSVDCFILMTGTANKFDEVNQLLVGEGLKTNEDLLCITTSNPVFLSFSKNNVPDLVIHNADDVDFNLRQDIHNALTTLTSKPIVEVDKKGKRFFVESGLPGKPWFQLLKDPSISMAEVKQRSFSTLKRFEEQILQQDAWNSSVDIVSEFNKQFDSANSIRNFESSVVDACTNLVASYPPEQVLRSSWQHGDYCINNLIFSENETFIIDFEEFGDTLMPLQDRFSLALSFYIQANVESTELLSQELAYCLKGIDKSLQPLLPILFIYHLLFRLGEWGVNPNRAFICEWIQNILVTYIKDPSILFSKHLNDQTR